MARFGASFLNDASNRLATLLGIDGALSADPSSVEKLVSVVLVGDATTPGYGRRARRFGITNSLSNGFISCWQAISDCVITDIQISTDVFAVLSTNQVAVWGAANAVAGVVQGGAMLDNPLTGEQSPIGYLANSGAMGTIFAQNTLQSAVSLWEVPLGPGFYLPAGARINIQMQGLGNTGRAIVGGYVFGG